MSPTMMVKNSNHSTNTSLMNRLLVEETKNNVATASKKYDACFFMSILNNRLIIRSSISPTKWTTCDSQ